MKRYLVFSSIIIISFIDFQVKAAPGVPPHELRIVKQKLTQPYTTVYQPIRVKKGHVWRKGYWQWNKRKQTYVWIRAHSVRQKHGKRWINGHWSKVKGGWVYHQGFWA